MEACALISRAIEVAAHFHARQADRNGAPYILHPLRVMNAVRTAGFGEDFQIIGVLHDVLELDADALALGRLDPGRLLHDDVGIHHDEAAVCVPDKAFVARLRDKAGDSVRAETDVEHRLHHAGHRTSGT